jgi:hypothetical protein
VMVAALMEISILTEMERKGLSCMPVWTCGPGVQCSHACGMG